MGSAVRLCSACGAEIGDVETTTCTICGVLLDGESTEPDQLHGETSEMTSKLTDEDLGYTDQAWLRGGRYDIDPPKDET